MDDLVSTDKMVEALRQAGVEVRDVPMAFVPFATGFTHKDGTIDHTKEPVTGYEMVSIEKAYHRLVGRHRVLAAMPDPFSEKRE